MDPEFAKVRNQFVSKARNEAEADEEFEPKVDGETGIIYHKVMDLAETTIQIYEDENVRRASGGLSRELNRSLKLVKKGFHGSLDFHVLDELPRTDHLFSLEIHFSDYQHRQRCLPQANVERSH